MKELVELQEVEFEDQVETVEGSWICSNKFSYRCE